MSLISLLQTITFFQRKNIFITIKYAEFIKIDTKTRKIQ
jgi:hypothetical protein